jgi:hypothetical protein
MPRTANRGTFVRGRVARVTRVDNCGRVVYGEYNQSVSEGVITAEFTANTTEIAEINVPNFSGKRCIYEPAVTELAGYSLVLTFCNVDFEMFEILTGQTLVFDAAGTVIGLEVDTANSLEDQGFALEIWAGAQGGDVCDDPNAQGEFGYMLLPYLKGGIVGDFSVANAEITFTVTGASTRDGNRWGSGPYAVERDEAGDVGALFQPVSPTAAFRLQLTSVAPPEEFVGSRPVLDPTSDPLTSIAAVEGLTPQEADFATTPASTGPVWWEFGDGTWDYVVAPGATTHEYAEAGTYTARASQDGVTWSEVEVTVPFA